MVDVVELEESDCEREGSDDCNTKDSKDILPDGVCYALTYMFIIYIYI